VDEAARLAAENKRAYQCGTAYALRWGCVARQQFGNLLRWPTLVALDLLQGDLGAADLAGEVRARQVKRLAARLQPLAERGGLHVYPWCIPELYDLPIVTAQHKAIE
jgi:hypothetical protein